MFRKFLHQVPFFRFLIPLLIGIVLKINIPLLDVNYSVILFLFFVVAIFLKKNHLIIAQIVGVAIFLFMLAIGVILVHIKQKNIYPLANKKMLFVATVIRNPEEKANTIKTILKIDLIRDSVGWVKPKTKVLAYVEKDTISRKFKIGDRFIAKAFINEVKHRNNPYSFNYKNYLKYKQIYYQVYLKSNAIQVIENARESKLILYFACARQKLLNIYKLNNIKGDEFAVLSALSLGLKTALSPDLKASFAASGAMHILAVSGLHVGIIYLIVSRLLLFLRNRKSGRVLKAFIIILVLIFYSLLTGFSSSVVRASIMFSFVCISKTFTRQISIYNTLSASAFVMLLYNPYLIMDVGFQLSYLAVLSIVFFQPKIYSFFEARNKLVDYLWQLISVSVAVQIATFPLTVYYFEQFPIYFILSNILIIPVVTILIYGAVLLFVFSFSGTISGLIARFLNFVTQILNDTIRFIENLPYAKLDSLVIDKIELVLLGFVILFLSFFIVSRKIRFFRTTLYFIILFIGYNILTLVICSKTTMFVVHDIPKHTAINLLNKDHCQLYTSLDKKTNSKEIEFFIAPLLQKSKVNNFVMYNNEQADFLGYYSLKNIRVINIYNSNILKYKYKNKLNIDYLILSNNIKIPITDLLKYFNFKQLVFDSSNHKYTIDRWTKECNKLNVNFYSIPEQGAFVRYL